MSEEMREILFRGKSKRTKEWLFGDYEHFYVGTDLHVYIDDWGKNLEEVVIETVGQFTGLTDKNGKKIFEGDIIEISGLRFPVGFRNSSFCTLHKSDVQFFFSEQFLWNHKERKWEKPNYFTVIGNIHDNPELLEEATNV